MEDKSAVLSYPTQKKQLFTRYGWDYVTRMDVLQDTPISTSVQELHDPWKETANDMNDNGDFRSKPVTSKKESLLSRFYKRKIRPTGDRSKAYQPIVESIDEDEEPEHIAFKRSHSIKKTVGSSVTETRKKKRNKLQEKSATFDYTDLKNEIEYQSRINIRRTAICAKSKSADAIQLETFLVVSRLKQFDLL